MERKVTEQTKPNFCSNKLAVALMAVLLMSLFGCGGQSNSDSNNGDAAAQSISAEPAFVSRSCDGEKSPNRFCPGKDH